MVTIRSALTVLIMTALLVIAGGCEQLGLLGNNKARIAGSWYLYEYGFKDDASYHFAEGVIRRDDIAWGTYKFVKNSIIEVVLGDLAATYLIEFTADEEVMVWYEMMDGTTRVDRYEWRRN